MADTGEVDVGCGSVNTTGLPIQLTGTGSTTAVLLHTAVAGTTAIDVIVLTPYNTSASTVTVTFEVTASAVGVASATTERLQVQVRANERAAPVVLRANNGLKIRAFASAANVVNVTTHHDSYTK